MASVVLSTAGCDDNDDEEEPSSQELVDEEEVADPEGGFYDGVDCESDGDKEVSPGDDTVLFGVVLAPDGQLDGSPRAEVPQEGYLDIEADDVINLIGGGVEVSLSRTDDLGEPEDEALAKTMTDERGRWCLSAKELAESEANMVIIAGGVSERLRSLTMGAGQRHIEAGHEALLRLLVEEGHRPSKLKAHIYDELGRRADDAIDDPAALVSSGMSVESYVARLMETMGGDEALMEAIDAAHPE